MFTYICFARRLETVPENRCTCTLFADSGIVSTFQIRNGFNVSSGLKSSAAGREGRNVVDARAVHDKPQKEAWRWQESKQVW